MSNIEVKIVAGNDLEKQESTIRYIKEKKEKVLLGINKGKTINSINEIKKMKLLDEHNYINNYLKNNISIMLSDGRYSCYSLNKTIDKIFSKSLNEDDLNKYNKTLDIYLNCLYEDWQETIVYLIKTNIMGYKKLLIGNEDIYLQAKEKTKRLKLYKKTKLFLKEIYSKSNTYEKFKGLFKPLLEEKIDDFVSSKKASKEINLFSIKDLYGVKEELTLTNFKDNKMIVLSNENKNDPNLTNIHFVEKGKRIAKVENYNSGLKLVVGSDKEGYIFFTNKLDALNYRDKKIKVIKNELKELMGTVSF